LGEYQKAWYAKWKLTHPNVRKERTRKYRQDHPEFCERQRNKVAEYRRNHPEKNREHMVRLRSKNRKLVSAKQRLYGVDNPEKIRAQQLSANLPLNDFCELCPPEEQRSNNLQKHHPDHKYPEIYVTVCPSCHKFAEGYGRRLIARESELQ
jgi:hypothetical protein